MKLLHRGKTREIYSFEGGVPTHSDFKYNSGRYYVRDREVLNVNNDGSVGLLFDDGDLEVIVEASKVSPEEFDRAINRMFKGQK